MKKVMKWSQITFLGNLAIFIMLLSLTKIINLKSEFLWSCYAVSLIFLLASFFVFVFLKIIFNYKKIYQFLKIIYFKGLIVYRSKSFRKLMLFTFSFFIATMAFFSKIMLSFIRADSRSTTSPWVEMSEHNDEMSEYNDFIFDQHYLYKEFEFKIGDEDRDFEYDFDLGDDQFT